MAERKWTTEYFRERLAKERPGWVHVSGEVTANISRVMVRCPEGHVSEKEAFDVFRYECKMCVIERKRLEAEREFFKALRRRRYEPLEQYKNSATPILVRCPNGSEWKVSKTAFMDKKYPLRCLCSKCKPIKHKKRKHRTSHEAAAEARRKGFRFDPADYKSTSTLVRGVWIKCGHEDNVLPSDLFRGKAGCRTCAGVKKKTTEEYREEVEAIAPGVVVLEEYVNSYTKILHRCGTCGHEWRTTPSHLLRGRGCPECARRKLSKMRRGENNPNYNPELTDEEREVGRNTPEDYEWMKSVKKRDKYTCQYCGRRGKLNSHHLFAYNQYEPLRYELLNGVTLCASCHYEKGHPRGFVGDETIYEFIDTIRKALETAKGDQKECLLNLLAEMERRVPILEAALNESKNENITKEEAKELAAV